MTLPAKVEQLRIHLGMEGALPINAVATKAVAELGLDAEVQGMNLRQKIDACFAALDTFGHLPSPGPELAEVVHPAIVPMGEPVGESTLAADARVRAAEMRAERAEAELRAQQSRLEAEAKARREAEEKARREAAAERARR